MIESKPHYELLDGLRGVAAIMVVWFHIFEAFATSPTDQMVNHGYLAVDFFFALSGFVMGYAYDDRLKEGQLTVGSFFKRRLIRLHPLVVVGCIIGAITFCIQGQVKWDGTSVGILAVLLSMLAGCFLIPSLPSSVTEVRGNGEMFPLNGPSWSLFFEYLANVFYVLILRRLSNRNLCVVVATSGTLLTLFAVFNFSGFYHLGVGWTLADWGLPGGFLRVLFSFSAGLLMFRLAKPGKIRGAFFISSILIVLLLLVPHLENANFPWLNGIYDSFCVLAAFPLIIFVGISGKKSKSKHVRTMVRLLGKISYPLYAIHYPFMYLFYAWVWNNKLSFSEVWSFALLLFIVCLALSYAVLKFYDEPLRRFLKRKFM